MASGTAAAAGVPLKLGSACSLRVSSSAFCTRKSASRGAMATVRPPSSRLASAHLSISSEGGGLPPVR